MDFKKIIDEAKKETTEKAAINLVIPKENKIKFEELCKKNGITVTKALNTFIDISIKENKG